LQGKERTPVKIFESDTQSRISISLYKGTVSIINKVVKLTDLWIKPQVAVERVGINVLFGVGNEQLEVVAQNHDVTAVTIFKSARLFLVSIPQYQQRRLNQMDQQTKLFS
jgi:hypothetical protein